MNMEQCVTSEDDGVRAGNGVVASLGDLGDGRSRIIFDDVVTAGNGANRAWSHSSFFTSNAYPESSLEEMTLSDDQYRDIGIALVARLLALNGRVPK